MQQPAVPSDLTTSRIEAFSDGVFAIAITLLIVELKVPDVRSNAPDALARALLRLWPSYFGYVFSFVIIGIYWVNHHFMFGLYERSNHVFVLLNLLFLMSISFLPFPTAVLAAYIADEHHRHTAIRLYAFALFLPALTWFFTLVYASRDRRLLIPGLEDGYIDHLTRKYGGSVALYLLAVLLTLWNDLAGLALCVVLTLLYLLPTRRPTLRSDLRPTGE